MSRIAGMMKAVASRPTPDAQPKPDARALVGNTSDAKIWHRIARYLHEEDITKPATMTPSPCPLVRTRAITPAQRKAQDRGDLSARVCRARYIMNKLAQGTAEFIARCIEATS